MLPESSEWYTNPPDSDQISYRLAKQPAGMWQKTPPNSGLIIKVNPGIRFQSILGIGTSFDETSIYAMRKGKTNLQIDHLLRSLLSPQTGMGLNLFRICIGSSDFSDGRSVSEHPQGFYSYQDNPDEPFSIQPDIDLGIIDFLKRVQKVAAELQPAQKIKFFASCWSPPPWMKTSGSLIGGTLKPGYEKKLAQYFRKFIEAYRAQGIPVYAITLQNEPNFLPATYPGMRLSPQQQLDLTIATYEEFHLNLDNKAEIATKIWINDHNFEHWINADFILTALEEMNKKHYVHGTAFHNYSNAPAAKMKDLFDRHPQTDILFTEHSEWGVSGMYNIQQYFRNQARSYMYWVTMTTAQLDEHNQGPYNTLAELSPTLLIESGNGYDRWYKTPEYYLIGQFSKFIKPGAVRIACDQGSPDNVSFVSFLNPDTTIVLVAVNQTERRQPFHLEFKNRYFQSNIPGKTVGTYVWKAID